MDRYELNFQRKDAKTQRRNDFREADSRAAYPTQPCLPPAAAEVERSALFASLRLCVRKIDRHRGGDFCSEGAGMAWTL
jgi:hypothetical protein